ncbi:hypothetical protein L7F22_004412 [Adiantum nelumboides]|nr:hypothetical protein [Adiantum nelumboides]
MRLALELANKSYDLPTNFNASHITIRLVDECLEGPRCDFTYSKALKMQRGSFEHPSASRMVSRLALELAGKSYGLSTSSDVSRMAKNIARFLPRNLANWKCRRCCFSLQFHTSSFLSGWTALRLRTRTAQRICIFLLSRVDVFSCAHTLITSESAIDSCSHSTVMAAVEQRIGVVRRGVTPAAPKPINLPSQKFENHQLIPDVELVPRGACCWGNAGRPAPASAKLNEKTDLASLPSGVNNTEEQGSKEHNDLGSTDEAQSPAEKSDVAPTVESSSTSFVSSTVHVSVAETCKACSNLEVGSSSAEAGSDSLVDSDAGSVPESVGRPSSSESYSSSSGSPTTRVEVQKHFNGVSQVYVDDCKKAANFQAQQETHVGNDTPQGGAQDFGYFEGFYGTQFPFPRPGVPYPNGLGMAVGHGMQAEQSHHYSCLGVPYYDSAKDKEIVVITMVGNPGVYGNYLPYPGFPDQYGSPSVYGSFPLQFGHFENFVGPQVSKEMNPMFSGEDSGYGCYEQDNHKHGWVNRSFRGVAKKNNGTRLSTSPSCCYLNPVSDDCSKAKRIGRQRAVNRSRRTALREVSPAAFAPERRVTLLTKVSRHEVIISDTQRKSKYGGIRQGESTSSSLFVEDATEALSAPESAPNSMNNSVCATQLNGLTLLKEDSNCDGAQSQSGAGQAAPESTYINFVGGVDVEEGCIPDVSQNLSSCEESYLLQAPYKESNIEDHTSEANCNGDPKTAVCEPSISAPAPAPAPTPTPTPTLISTAVLLSQAEIGLAVREQVSTPTCSTVLCQVPDSIEEKFSGLTNNIGLNPDDRLMSKVGEIQLDCSCDSLTGSLAYMEGEVPREDVNGSTILSSSISGALPNENMVESTLKLSAWKSMKRWRRKGSIDVIQSGYGGADQKIQEVVVDKGDGSENFQKGISRRVMHGVDTFPLPLSPRALSQGSMSLSSCVPAAFSICNFSGCDDFADASTNGSTTVCLVNTESDILQMDKSSKKGMEGCLSMSGVSECAPGFCSAQTVDSPKSSSASGSQTPLSRIVSGGAGKRWRPKLFRANGHDKSVREVSGAIIGKFSATSALSGLQITEIASVGDCTSSIESIAEDGMHVETG